MVAMTLFSEVVVSAGKVADLQRVGMLSSLGKFSISPGSTLTFTYSHPKIA